MISKGKNLTMHTIIQFIMLCCNNGVKYSITLKGKFPLTLIYIQKLNLNNNHKKYNIINLDISQQWLWHIDFFNTIKNYVEFSHRLNETLNAHVLISSLDFNTP